MRAQSQYLVSKTDKKLIQGKIVDNEEILTVIETGDFETGIKHVFIDLSTKSHQVWKMNYPVVGHKKLPEKRQDFSPVRL